MGLHRSQPSGWSACQCDGAGLAQDGRNGGLKKPERAGTRAAIQHSSVQQLPSRATKALVALGPQVPAA